MKVLRHPIALMYLVFIVLVVVALLYVSKVFDVFNQDSTELIPKPSSTEYTRWELPEGATARLGKGAINDIKFSPDGARFAVATTIGVWMYDAKTGAEISLLTGDRHEFNGIAFSSDGNTLSGVNSDGIISHWDLGKGKQIPTFPQKETPGYLYTVDFSEDSTKLAIGILHRENHKVQVSNLVTGIPPAITTNIDVGEKEGLSPTIALSPDNRLLATSKEEKGDRYPIHVWNPDTGEKLFTLEREEHGYIRGLVFSTDGKTLASSDHDTILLWDLDTKTVRAAFKAEMFLRSLAFSPNSRLIASGDDDGMVNLWKVTVQQQGLAGKIIQNLSTLKLTNHREEIVALAFSPDGKMLLSGSKDGTIRAWDTNTGQQQYICPGHVSDVIDIAVSAEGNTLISVHHDEEMLIKWDINTGHPFSSSLLSPARPRTVSQDANKFVVSKLGHKIQLWDTDKVRQRYNLNGHGYPSEYLSLVSAFSPDEKMVAVTTSEYQIGTIHLWDIAKPSKTLLDRIFNPKSIQPIHTFQGNQQKVKALAFSPNSKTLASCGDGLEINLWSTETGNKLFTLTGDRSSIYNLSFSPDGNMLASAGNSTVYLWDLTDLKTANLVRKINTPSTYPDILFSPDGRTLVSEGRGSIRLIDPISGTFLSIHTGHSDGLMSRGISKLIFLQEGKTLASAGRDGTILLWDWEKICSFISEKPLSPDTPIQR